MEIKVVEEVGGIFQLYVDNKAALGLKSKIEAEKLVDFLRHQIDKPVYRTRPDYYTA